MQTETELSPLFSYSIIVLCIFLLILFLILLFLFILHHSNKNNDIKSSIVVPNIKDMNLIKNKYLSLLQNLLNDFNNRKINNRKAYQTLSKLIRHFVFEATNIKVQYYTLTDIRQIGMPILYELIYEYYNPEFSKLSKGNIINSINKARMVIEKWK